MVNYIQLPVTDESIYSVIGKYFRDTMLPIISKTNIDFFSQNFVKHSIGLPSKIGVLKENTKLIMNWEVSEILKNYTLWPLFDQIVPPQQLDELYEFIINGRGKNNFNFYPFLLPFYCPECIKLTTSDKELFWNRLHQIPNIQICFEHKCYLKKVNNSKLGGLNWNKIYPPDISYCTDLQSEFCNCQITISIAERMCNLLKGEVKINPNYSSRLKELGYVNGRMILVDKVKNEFNELYPLKYLKSVGEESNFIPNLINFSTRYKNITRHVLLDFFICNLKRNELPPKERFWDAGFFSNLIFKCRNRQCRHFQLVQNLNPILKYQITHKRTVGYFSCECEWEYTISFPKEGSKPTYAKRRKPKNTETKKDKFPISFIKSQRKKFLAFYKIENKSANQKNVLGSIRKWLRLHDSTWLKKQDTLLAKLKRANQILRIKAKEKNELKKIESALKKLRAENFSRRITKTVLLNAAQVTYGKQYNQLYTEIHKFLNKSIESVEDYRVRKMRQKAEQITTAGGHLTYTALVASYPPQIRKKLRKVVDEIITSYSTF